MSLNSVTPGKNLPESFNVVIEIPMDSDPIKYEVDKESGAIFVDRFMTTAMYYPSNYGYVPQTLSGDGDRAHLRQARATRRVDGRHRREAHDLRRRDTARAQRVEQVGERQQRVDHGTLQASPQPAAGQQQGRDGGQTRARWPVLPPQQPTGDSHPRQAQRNRAQSDLEFVADALAEGAIAHRRASDSVSHRPKSTANVSYHW